MTPLRESAIVALLAEYLRAAGWIVMVFAQFAGIAGSSWPTRGMKWAIERLREVGL